MNQERQQAYQNFILQLLNCPTQTEQENLIEANQDLLNVELLQELETVAQMMSDGGNEDAANGLRDWRNQLAEMLLNVNFFPQAERGNLTEEDLQVYLQFFLKVLRKRESSNGDEKDIYSLLEANTDKLDSNFAKILRYWGTSTFEQVEADIAKSIAQTIINFGNLIQQFTLGDKASNMEIAIASYETALAIYTCESFPQEWNHIQNNLGIAYSERIEGNKAKNIEKAIDCYNSALQSITRERLPQDWAQTQYNLGNAYIERIEGDKAENIEKSIECYNNALQIITPDKLLQEWANIQNNLGLAYSQRIKGDKAENIETVIDFFNCVLQVYTRKDFEQKWAQTQNNLAIAYSERIVGNKAENIEQAIDCYNRALQIITPHNLPQDWAQIQLNLGNTYINRTVGDKAENIEKAINFCNNALQLKTHETFPQDWAQIHNNLGNAYRERIVGDKAENIEKAIESYNSALLVRTREDFSQDWAQTQNNLGAAYIERIKGNKAENIKKSIDCFYDALKIYTRKAFPQNWALIQHNLGAAYSQSIEGDKAENIEKSIEYYNNALQVRTLEDLPQDWAQTQINLSNAYRERIEGDKAENIEKAINSCNFASQVYTFQTFPQNWAMIQNHLGNAYSQRIKRDKAENIKKAIEFYHNALQVRTPEAFPQRYVETLFNLSILYQDKSSFNSAYNSYKSVIEMVELLRGEIISGEESKQKQAEQWNGLYLRMVEVCLELGENFQAFEYIERSKTRNLVELILERDSKNIFPSNVVTKLEELRDEIAKGQYQIQNGTAENPTALAQYIQELRQQKKNLEDEYLPVGSGFDFDKFQKTLDSDIAILEWYIVNGVGLETFIITSDNFQRFNSSSSYEGLKSFIDWNFNYLNAYYNKKSEWKNNLADYLTQLAEILNIEEILKEIPKNCSHLILIPHRYLHLFPLHALPLSDGSFLCDKFPDGVSYAPSCQLLQQINSRKRVDFKSLFAIQNPTEDLDYTDLEVETISSLFTDKEILSKKQATQTALSQASSQIQQANYLHFSCHGTFNPETPQNSCLLLSGSIEKDELDLNKCLTLGNLFERDFNLNQCRLVVLSACETGLIDSLNTSDEYIGLPSGFLYAGSSSVVSSLWTVDDLSTSFLMIKFIQNLKNIENISVPVALNQAQNWLRNVTKEDLQEWTGNLSLDSTKKGKIRRYLRERTEEKPFQSPFYWAAFTAVGK